LARPTSETGNVTTSSLISIVPGRGVFVALSPLTPALLRVPSIGWVTTTSPTSAPVAPGRSLVLARVPELGGTASVAPP